MFNLGRCVQNKTKTRDKNCEEMKEIQRQGTEKT